MPGKKTILITTVTTVIVTGSAFAYSRYLHDSRQNASGTYNVDNVQTYSPTPTGENNNSQDSSSTQSSPNKETNRKPSLQALVAPSGNFVSAHSVNANSTIESVCVTSPKAKCKIVLTRGATIKSLNEKTTDSEGVTAWTWSPKDLGISYGSWEVKAIATLDSQTKETKDAMNLKVES